MREVVIAAAVRTAIGKRNGGLSGTHPADLSAIVLNALAGRTGIDPAVIDDVIWGCVSQVGRLNCVRRPARYARAALRLTTTQLIVSASVTTATARTSRST